jgi:hypothetical protein
MLKKIFFFLVFLSTVYFRNISNAHQLSGKNVTSETMFNINEMPKYFSTETALLLNFKNSEEDTNQDEMEHALALQQGHATHIP